jgi:GT2 family glycosyltransferase
MTACNEAVSFVVATKDRPDDLRRMLDSLAAQSRRPDEIIIVDSSAVPVELDPQIARSLSVRYIRHAIPSAAKQRNVGIQAVGHDMTLVGFLDDDVILAPDALEKMLNFWASAPADLGGCAFNMMNSPITPAQDLKASAVVRWLGLYSNVRGSVTRSGWQTLVGTIERTQWVEWLQSGAALWRADVFHNHRFDEFFDSYSYLEDVDFSYRVGRTRRLAVVADARYWHYPSTSGRVNALQFGTIEVRNRLYIVRKHHLSTGRCLLNILIRLTMTVGTAVRRWDRDAWRRALGNCRGLALYLFAGRVQELKSPQP